jgi:hypothetical protein
LRDANSYAHSYGDRDSDINTNVHAYSYGNINAYADSNTFCYADCDGCCHTYSDTDVHARQPVCDRADRWKYRTRHD